MTRYWLGVVSWEHVRRGVALGIAQANHGKRTSVERMRLGEGLVYYSPREAIRTGPAVRSFTAIGTIDDRPAWQAEPAPPMPGATVAADLRSTATALDLGLLVAPESGAAGPRMPVASARGGVRSPTTAVRGRFRSTNCATNWRSPARRTGG